MAAARPRTLPAAIVPVLVGLAVAQPRDARSIGRRRQPRSRAALLIQIGTNLANDYYDFVNGADTPERLGPTRDHAGRARRAERRCGMRRSSCSPSRA